METISIIAILFVPAGILLPLVANYFLRSEAKRKLLGDEPPTRPPKSGYVVLGVFTLIALIFGAFTLLRYWAIVMRNQDLVIFGIWLFLVMVLGMFVQVLITNYAADPKFPFRVRAAQLIFPVLLSPIVFYAIWTTAASAPRGAFVIYCAFLNGYFWESTVSKVKP